MASFSYSQFKDVMDKPRAENANNEQQKIGYFKLDDGASALVRVNCSTLDDLAFATVHKPVFGKKFEGLQNPWAGISCARVPGDYTTVCPLCKAAENADTGVDKAKSVVFVQMLVAYKDATTGQFSKAVPVVWERPSGFAKELAGKLANYGDLRNVIFMVSRVGKKTDTRYNFDFVPIYNDPKYVPADFSAFNGIVPNRKYFYEKSAAEIDAFIRTGSFPEVENAQAPANPTPTDADAPTYTAQAPVTVHATDPVPVAQAVTEPVSTNEPVPTRPAVAPSEAQTAPAAPAQRPTRTFSF